VGTVPVAIVLAVLTFGVINSITSSWNQQQCEHFLQSKGVEFTEVPPLMLQWEKDHKLQWGAEAKEYYQRRLQPCNIAEEIIEDESIINE
ncbi:MAG: hypothetical protein K2K82_06340, partial [Muribaculaceae bacterium]|nr:hypothetical protein [Muribaculaceae bacterium]